MHVVSVVVEMTHVNESINPGIKKLNGVSCLVTTSKKKLVILINEVYFDIF